MNITVLDEQGRVADEKLSALGLVMTQGGEPTFVPHDTRAPEWNVAALGENKLFYARRLGRHLAATLYPGAVLLQSFGKQYPGEPLPRWQIGLYRCRSGVPLWKNYERLRSDEEPKTEATAEDARRLARKLATALKVKGSILTVYEDFEAYLRAQGGELAERLLPRFSRRHRKFKNGRIDPQDWEVCAPRLDPAGWVLPLNHDGEKWVTADWRLAKGEDFLLFPGDSPVGLRLPLHRLPEDALRCALTVECKDGELIVFLPPVPTFANFCELVRMLEKVATRLNLPPLRLEGYPPPRDPELEAITFMSDPGVIEVNLPPAADWPEFGRVVRGLFAAADASGLRGYKYQMSGRCVGSGGGAHIILGGPDLERNPFQHRPHLLASFLRFVQHHPSLSYLFTGLYTGPSCQAPRVDESAFEMPYELEITLAALEQLPTPADASQIDAMLRNLLMDWNGNTHRAEISVDKFHNQDAPNGRLGLVEFRAFEMLPTAEMLLAANVLLRALGAAFAEKPYTGALIDWRGALHDRFALPWFLRRDLEEVLAFLNQRGFSFDSAWFEAHFDFRFPIVHQFTVGETQWTVRKAIEPWPVMGDHTGTGRIVDATTDRLQLLVEGEGAPSRLITTVNGWRVPLTPCGEASAVAGIRYRLFDNLWGLQPQVRAHSPLQFEIIDAESGRIEHAFEYLNWKREGGGYEGPPQSDAEARQRIRQRVVEREDRVRTEAQWREVPTSPLAPLTLDLRRF